MPDLLILWLVGLAPVLTMAVGVLAARWTRLPAARREREIVVAAGISVCLALGLAFHVGYSTRSRPHFQEPAWLWLLVPCYALILLLQWRSLAGLSRGRLWLAFLLRSAVVSLLVLALAGLQVVMVQDVLTVLYVLDRSKSVPDSEAKRALEFVKRSLPAKGPDDRVGLLVFGGQAAVQIAPKATFQAPDLADLRAEVHPEATNIQEALRKARATLPEDTMNRVVLFSDGRQTEGQAADELKSLREALADLWIVPLGRSDAPEMLVEKIEGISPELRLEDTSDARVYVQSNHAAKARVSLFLNDPLTPDPPPRVVELSGQRKEPPVIFPGLKLRSGGPREIQATLEPLDPADDTLSGNNHAYTFTDVQAESRILILTTAPEEVAPLREALAPEKVALDLRFGASLPEDPEEYRRYDAIVLANLPRAYLGDEQMAVIESCVRDQGAGLVMIGGDQSFGAGGYLNTPIERALPVSMDVRNQKVVPSGALVIVLHTCEFADGNSWGKKISKAAINVLSPQDYAGLLLFGFGGGASGNQWLFPPTPVVRKNWMFGLIDGCAPSDMPDLDQIVAMAVTALQGLQNVSLKHCIVITDGDPSPPTRSTIAAAKQAKVTVTVVTIAPHGGADVGAMKNLAEQTGGSYYNPKDPRQLPQIFTKEAAIVRKSLIYADEQGIPVQLGSPGEVLRQFGPNFPKVNAFVVTTLKDRAELHLYAVVEGEKTAILARWAYGLGKAFAFTSDTGARWAPQWRAWDSDHKFWANLFHWVARQRMPARHKIETHLEGNTGKVMVEALDEQGRYVSFARLAGSASDPRMGQDVTATAHPLRFKMTAPGRYAANFPVTKEGAYTVTVTDLSDPAKPASIVTGLVNSYSWEYLLREEEGQAVLARLAEIAGPDRKVDLDRLLEAPLANSAYRHNLAPVREPRDLFWPLLLAALCLLPLDIAVRRLRVEPQAAAAWLWRRALAPVGHFLRRKKAALAAAAAEAARKAEAGKAPPPPLVPTGEETSALAQGRYEEAGASAAAREFDLKPGAAPPKPVVGGTKLSPADDAASEYTRALLKAKKRARRDDGKKG